MSDPLLVALDDGLARLTLNRPDRLNAFNAELATALERACLELTARDDVGAIVIDANGPAFCAGGDVIEMATTGSGGDIERLALAINRGIEALITSTIPVVCAAHGTTAGGGLGILLASDYAIVGADSRVGSLYAELGLTPDLSVTAHLARAVGQRRALQLVLTDRKLTADEALEWGLAAEVVSPTGEAEIDVAGLAGAVRGRAEEVARFWLAGASGAYGQAKRLVRSQPARSLTDQLAEEARTIGAAFETEDAQARIAAFTQAATRRAQKETTS